MEVLRRRWSAPSTTASARLRAELEELGELDNTIFIFTSDNGASREGRESGTVAYFRDVRPTSRRQDHRRRSHRPRLDEIGGPTTWPHYPRGWAMACNTPFRLYKITTFRGGHSVPLVVSWPRPHRPPTRSCVGQYTHVTDVLPTLADLIGLDAAHQPQRPAGRPARRRHLRRRRIADAEAPTAHTEQYYECVGHRAYYRDGWHAVTFHPTSVPFSQDQWQLFDARADVNELHDLADQHPDRVAELVDAWEEAAWRNQVFPLDEGTGLSKLLVPPFAAAADAPVRILPGTPTLERFRSSRLIARSTFGITVEWDYQRGDKGILVAHGGQEGGYVLWVEDGELGFTVNALGTPMPVGQAALGDTSRRLDVRFEIGSPRMWKVTVDLDGTPVMKRDEIPQMTSYLPYEGIDVGLDRRSPVSWDLHQRHGAFPFTGTIHAVTYAPGPATPEDDQRRLEDLRAIGTGLE